MPLVITNYHPSPVRLPNIYSIDINSLLKPPLLIRDLNIIPAHLTLPHQPVVRECPVLEAVRAVPLPLLVMPFIPKLDCDL